MDREIIRDLIEDLLGCEAMLLVIDSGGAVSEMHAPSDISTEFDGRWATIEAGEWHVHLDLDAVEGAQFVENSNHGHESMMPKLYYLRLSGSDEERRCCGSTSRTRGWTTMKSRPSFSRSGCGCSRISASGTLAGTGLCSWSGRLTETPITMRL